MLVIVSLLPSDRDRQGHPPTSPEGARSGLADQEVSWVVGELDPKDLQGNLAPDFPWREMVFRLLVEQKAEQEAQDFLWCGSNYRGVMVCHDDITHSKPIPISCHRRYCPQCARRAAAKLVDAHTPQILKIVQDNTNKDYRLRSVVLTTKIDLYAPDAKEQVKLAVGKVNEFFDLVGGAKIREKQRNRWSEANSAYCTGEGLIYSIEFGPLGNLLHFHCLWFGRYIPHRWISETWEQLSGCPVNWIESVTNTEPAIREALKYTAKLIKSQVDPATGEVIEFLPSPKYIARLAHILRGSRRVFGRGVFRGLKNDLEEEEEDPGCKCGICGGRAELVNMLSWTSRFYNEYLPAMRQLDLRPGNNSAGVDETAQPPPRPTFGKLLTDIENERISAIRRSKVKFEDDWFTGAKR
jgi:hypothetical protein